MEAKGSTGGEAPNDLLDRRDELLQQLSAQVSINTVSQDDGTVNVYMGQGQALVVGFDTNALTTQTSSADPKQIEVAVGNGASTVVISDWVSGGQLGALLEVRHGMLDSTSNALGRIALAVTTSFNDVHAQNMDLRGQQGGDFFGVPTLPVQANSTNVATGAPLLTVADVGALEASDYNLRFNGTNWTLTRLSDGAPLGNVAAGGSATFDGITVDVAGVAGAATGDTFRLQPMRVTSDLDVRVTDPRAVAAALPVRADVDSGNTAHLTVLDMRVTDATDPIRETRRRSRSPAAPISWTASRSRSIRPAIR